VTKPDTRYVIPEIRHLEAQVSDLQKERKK